MLVAMPTLAQALPGRTEKTPVAEKHTVLDARLDGEFPGMEFALVGLGCFWGAERVFWLLDGVVSTAVGYSAGYTPNPTYGEVCTGMTGQNEVVRVVLDPSRISYADVLKTFWEGHDPTQGQRQGNDVGTQYRSGIYVYNDAQREAANATRKRFQSRLRENNFSEITTEIIEAPPFYYAEDYHQQYLAKNPGGYCGLGGTGVSCD